MAAGVRLVVLGRQGAGKGTQCVRLSHRYAVPHISTGDMLRAAVRAQTPLGVEAASLMTTGELLPDELIIRMVSERLSERDARSRGFVLDGFPRTVVQAEMLQDILNETHKLHCVVNLEVPTDEVLQRLVSRRTCVDCGHIYSTSSPPIQGWTCDTCGGEVIQRPDDTAEAIMTRLQAYERETLPLIDFYSTRGLLETIDGSQAPDDVLRATVDAVERRKREME
jgi:adenylate kinase